MNTAKWIMGVGEYNNFIIKDGQVYDVSPGLPTKVPSQPAAVIDVKANLHHQVLLDSSGTLYCWGDESASILGSAFSSPTKVLDAKGSPIAGVKKAIPYSSQGQGILILKIDSTVWICGNTLGGLRGDGTAGGVADTAKPVPFPVGTVIIDICASTIAMALDNNGSVWTWGDEGEYNVANMLGQGTANPDPTRPAIVVLPGPVVQIAGGGYFNYALLKDGRLAGWTQKNTGYLGLNAAAQATPFILSLGLPLPIAAVFVNYMASFVILTDGSLWAWGDNACGCCGNGVEIDFANYSTPYFMNIDIEMGLPQLKPVQIGKGLSFVDVKTSNKFCLYAVAEDTNGNLYAWGRNKGGVQGNGVVEAVGANGALTGNYPNSWDVPWLTQINPFGLAAAKPTTSPICIKNASAAGCPVVPNIAAIPLQASAGNPQNITGSTIQLSGSASGGGPINYWFWKQISGPVGSIIVLPTSQNPKVMGLQPGTYVFDLTVTDSNWATSSSQVTITVAASGPGPRTVNAVSINLNGTPFAIPLSWLKITFSDGTTQ